MEIKVGDIITLKDDQTIEDNMDAGLGPVYSEFTVSEIENYTCGDAEWKFITFEESDLTLVRKSYQDSLHVFKLYFIPDDFDMMKDDNYHYDNYHISPHNQT